jgi:hypothetical protein
MFRLFLFAVVGVSFCAGAILDDFNRPDAGTLGPSWTVVSGGAQIISNQAAGLSDLSLVIYNGVSASGAYVDVYNTGTGLQYAALVLGYSGGRRQLLHQGSEPERGEQLRQLWLL